MTTDTLQQEIALARRLEPVIRSQRYSELARQLFSMGEIDNATELLERVDTELLDSSGFVDYVVIASEIAIAEQNLFRAHDLLTNDRLSQIWDQSSPLQQQSLYGLRAKVRSRLGEVRAGIVDRIALDALLTDPLDILENHDLLWQELTRLPGETLVELESNSADPIARGWYQLAVLSKAGESSLELLQQYVAQWAIDNPNHPASLEMPPDLQLLTSLIEQRPRHLALLLPMRGRLAIAGKAILDGFFAAYYSQTNLQQTTDRPGGNQKPQVSLFDTSREPVGILYEKAVAAGADLVIGPLEKDRVAQLQQRDYLPVAVLSLNYTTSAIGEALYNNGELNRMPEGIKAELPDSIPVTDNRIAVKGPVYQFGLSLEDEAIQVVERAWLEGHRHAMVIASSADWSHRAADAFIRHWKKRGGTVVIDRHFDKDSNYSSIIGASLAIDQSKNRRRKLERLFGKKLQFEPRRRQDIDMIFLVAQSSEGQQIKPTLAFHYARTIPVYSTSQIYSSAETAAKKRDLNGIRFTTLPWMLGPDNREKELVQQYINIPVNYERLYAMGADSWLLHDRLQQLARSEGSALYGNTGKLTLNRQQRIVREQPWAQVINGEVRVLPLPVREDTGL